MVNKELSNKGTNIVIDNTNVIASIRKAAKKNRGVNLKPTFKTVCPSGRQTSTLHGLVDGGLVTVVGHKMYATIILDQMDADDIHQLAKSIYFKFQTKPLQV